MSRKLKLLSLGMLALAGLSACATPSATHNATAQAVQGEMDAVARESIRQRENAKTINIEAVNNALLPPLVMTMPKVDNKPLEARFDLTVNNTPANQVFMAVVSGTRYNMLVPPGITGNISLNLKDVTVFEALEAIRDMYGYEYKVDANRIFIQPLTLQTRLFQVNYLTANRGGSSMLSVQSSSSGGTTTGTTGTTGTTAATTGAAATTGTTGVAGTTGATTGTTGTSGGGRSSSTVITTSNPKSNFWTELEASLKAIVGNENGRSVVINSMSGVIVVRAMPDELKSVTAYLKASQISIERQVILEAKIVEVQLNDGYQSGVNWAGFANLGSNRRSSFGVLSPDGMMMPNAAGGAAQTLGNSAISSLPGATLGAAAAGVAGSMFGMALQTSNFAALLNFLETQGSVHVLSSPRIATLNNQKAILKVGTDEYFITGFSTTSTITTTTSTTAGTVTPLYSSMFSGIALDVTPNINEHNEIILHVHPSVTSISEKNKFALFGQTGATGGTIPMASTSVSETDSIVRARDGQIVVIGGLMRQATFDDKSGLPGMSKPLFGQTSRRTDKRELILLLKPTVVDSDGSWSDDIVRSRDRMSGMTNH
ncbi:Secretin OutD [Gallionellaceae bacterium]|nr:Secretin OutD [Gallionellaceae bacterium]